MKRRRLKMPVEVKGVIELRKALKKFAPDLAKELTKEITLSLKVIQRSARGFVPGSAPGGLYSWDRQPTRAPKAFNTSGRVRPFPRYDSAEIKRGIVYRTGYGKPNSEGFRSLFRVKNSSAVGAIYEKAGRLNPTGSKQSKSNNPGAGARFVQQGPLYGSRKKGQDMRGRVLYRAWEQDEGKQLIAIFKAIDSARDQLNKRATVSSMRESA
jgi:hypothetical protein